MTKELSDSKKLKLIKEKRDSADLFSMGDRKYINAIKTLKTSSIIGATLSATGLALMLLGIGSIISSAKYYGEEWASLVAGMLAILVVLYTAELYVYIKAAQFKYAPKQLSLKTSILISINIFFFVSNFFSFNFFVFIFSSAMLATSIIVNIRVADYEKWLKSI